MKQTKNAAWRDDQLERLAREPLVGYHLNDSLAAEPVAFAALTALGYGLTATAQSACTRLLDAQLGNGAVSALLDDSGPYWPTALACIAWKKCSQQLAGDFSDRCATAVDAGLNYLLGCGGEMIRRNETVGHNGELVGWPWVLGTHSWVEPTALALMALRHGGRQSSPRAFEAAELLLDRQLATGGANYGNTVVLGQVLRPHSLPSAMSVVALHRVQPVPRRLKPTIRYLQHELNRPLASTSLCWTIHAMLSASGESSPSRLEFEWPLAEAIERLQQSGQNPHRANLLLLAMLGDESPLFDVPIWDLSSNTDGARTHAG